MTLSVFKNYLQRMIEANTEADQSGATVAANTMGFVGLFGGDIASPGIDAVVYDDVLLTGSDFSYADGLLAIEVAGTYSIMGYAVWTMGAGEVGERSVELASVDAGPAIASFPFTIGMSAGTPARDATVPLVLPIVGYLPAGAHVQVSLRNTDGAHDSTVSVYLAASRII